MSACNRLVNERNEGRRHARHIDALDHCLAATDHKPPMDHPHLRDKSKARRIQEDRAAEIQLENRILLQKMLNIDTKPSQFSAQNYSARGPRLQSSLHGEKQRRELDRITTANQNLLSRLQSAKPSIDVRGWEEEEMDRQALKFRLSQNACRGRGLKLPMPAGAAMQDGGQLPRLGIQSARFHEDDWARLTNHELDQKLLALECGHNSGYDM